MSVVFCTTVVGAIFVGLLYWAQSVCIPIALAVMFTFLLRPAVLTLQRWGLGRIPSVLAVVLAATVVIGCVGWVVASQMVNLAADLAEYSENLRSKVRGVRELFANSVPSGLQEIVNEVGDELKKAPAPDGEERTKTVTTGEPIKLVVEPEGVPWLSRLPTRLANFMEPLGTVALALVLTLFMLINSEDLRNRFIKVLGNGRLTATTQAVDDAGQRITRYFFAQLIINTVYGLALTVGLYLLNVDYAVLWGFLAALLRYVPYIGPWIAAILPVMLSIAKFPGWVEPFVVVGLIAVLELITNNLLEPWLYGQSMGVSAVGFLVAAAFWTFLWGPVGLVLSGPLTVCLVVLGKHVSHLRFFDTLLGDQPPLDPPTAFYQRLLANDKEEATQIVREFAKSNSAEQTFDGLLIPALICVQRDRDQDDLGEEDERFAIETIRELIGELKPSPGESPDVDVQRVRILGCPAREEADQLALEMLRHVLDPKKWDIEVMGTESLAAEVAPRACETETAIVCISSLIPGGLAQARYLCKRVKAQFPEVRLLVGRWGLTGDVERNKDQLEDAGAEHVAVSLLDAHTQLEGLFAVLSADQSQSREKRDRVAVTT